MNNVNFLRNCVILSGVNELTFTYSKSKNIMKLLKLAFVGLLFFYGATTYAQVSVNVNIGSHPMWAPTGYSEVRYYYLPDVEAYYDVPSSMFIYFNGVNWIHRTSLPSRYRNYDLYHGYKVVMTDYHGSTPYRDFREYKVKYAKGYRGKPQKTYGERPHQESSNYKKQNMGNSNKNYKKSNGSGHENNEKNKEHGGSHGKKK